MENQRFALAALPAPGELTTFYAYEGGSARSLALLEFARLAARREHATAPVLLLDADMRAPGLHHLLGHEDERPGLLELLTHCGELIRAQRKAGHPADEAMAHRVLEVADWRQYLERVDEGSAMYLLRVGRVDEQFAERVRQLDWQSLYQTCPALLPVLAEELTRVFRHVLVDLPAGRSELAATIQALMPRKCVGVFTPNWRSLSGLCGMVERTKNFRIHNEEYARPFVVYPLPVQARPDDRQYYQARLHELMEQTYGWTDISLTSYLDEVALPASTLLASGQPSVADRLDRSSGSLARPLSALLAWHEGDHMAWDHWDEVRLMRSVRQARALAGDNIETALPLAGALDALGLHYWSRGDELQALPCFTEAATLHARWLGEGHPHTLSSRMHQAAATRAHGRLPEARQLYEAVVAARERQFGAEHPDTLAAKAGLALTSADLGDWLYALAQHDAVLAASERLFGAEHLRTLDVLADHAAMRARHGELGRARMLYERLLEGRQRKLGPEHPDSLACSLALAAVLARLDEVGMARDLRQCVYEVCLRREGPNGPGTRAAREALQSQSREADAGDTVVCASEHLVSGSNGILEVRPERRVLHLPRPCTPDPLRHESLRVTDS